MNDNGKEVGVTISVVVDEATQAWLKQQAKKEDVSMSRIVRGIIAERRARQEKEANREPDNAF